MLRAVAIVTLLVPLVAGGYLLTAQTRSASNGGGSAPLLRAAATALEAHHRTAGTYAQLQLAGVRIVRADAGAYCVEAAGMRLAGPGGSPEPGSC